MSKERKINLLIISSYYPPTISIASNRILALSKYLDADKFQITVLTFGSKNSNYEQPKGVQVIRIANTGLFHRLSFTKRQPFIIHKLKALYNTVLGVFVVDEWHAWRKASFKYIKKNYNKEDFDFVISSFAPVASHLLALQLKKNGYSFQWIADMRDEMSNNLSLSHQQREKFRDIEKEIFKNAQAVSSATLSVNNSFKKASSAQNITCFEMKNGFDFSLPEKIQRNTIFTISSVGTFYGKQKPDLFLHAVASLIEEQKIDDVFIRFVGVTIPISVPTILQNKTKIITKVDHDKAIEFMQKSDANLLILSPDYAGAVPGKTYEYMASLKPIIAMFNSKGNSQLIDILQKSNLSYISEFADIETLKQNILTVYKNWETKTINKADISHINQFHRKKQIKIMEEYILQNANG